MNKEPDWIEHDGSAVCPVPFGHDVEGRTANGVHYHHNQPEYTHWALVTHYRDWTAFAAKQASAGVVPEITRLEAVWWAASLEHGPHSYEARTARDAVIAAAHEPKPVDLLREAVADAMLCVRGEITAEKLTVELRQRGVTVGEKG